MRSRLGFLGVLNEEIFHMFFINVLAALAYLRLKMISQIEIDRVWGSADFGSITSRLDVVRFGVLKCASGYYQGATSRRIITELGLINHDYKLTKLGRFCLWEWFSGGSKL
jgi:hypothetical protein